MMVFLGRLIALALLAQAPADRIATGEVVDDQGKPVADASGCPLLASHGLRQGRFGRGAGDERRRRASSA